jgi:uncharacterized protein YjbJ (UPF0337 family)
MLMSGKQDDLKGRLKEAAGDLTDDDELKRDGKVDRAKGSVKQGVERAKDKTEDAIDEVSDRIRD